MSGRCKSCGAEIRWVTSSTGRAMPLDPEPSPKGNLVLVEEESPDQEISGLVRAIGVASYERINGPLSAGEPRYTSHFATCPSAAEHRSAPPRRSGSPAVGRRR